MSINAGTLMFSDFVSLDYEIHAPTTTETWAEKKRHQRRPNSNISGWSC